jgi:hypothetical protein
VYSVGVETVMTGVQPAPDKTMFYGYIAGYAANEFVNGQGASSTPEFKLRLFANAVKIAHNWGVPFLGGKLESKLSLPLIYEQLHVASGKGSKAALGDISFAPIAVTWKFALVLRSRFVRPWESIFEERPGEYRAA